MALHLEKGEHKIESVHAAPSALVLCHSGKWMDQVAVSPSAAPALVLTNTGKRTDLLGRAKKYLKQVTGRLNDTELHLATLRGDFAAVKQILGEVEAQVTGSAGDGEFNSKVAEIRAAMANEAKDMGETALFVAAEKGFLNVMIELLKFSDWESLSRKNRSGFDALLVAAREGHKEIVQVLLDHDPNFIKTFGQSNVTLLTTAAMRGHTEIVKLLLEQVGSLIEISKANGKSALHVAARQGHLQVAEALLEKDPQLARRTDKMGQTALHMAVKGTSCDVVTMVRRNGHETSGTDVPEPERLSPFQFSGQERSARRH